MSDVARLLSRLDPEIAARARELLAEYVEPDLADAQECARAARAELTGTVPAPLDPPRRNAFADLIPTPIERAHGLAGIAATREVLAERGESL